MDAEIKLTLLIISLMERALEEIAKNQELRSSILEGAQNIDDWLQEKRGKINRRTTVESITLAINTSVVRDKNTICSIIAVITTLYATRKITRGAHVGGTLRKFFGENVFPHIDEKELRFAKPVNEKVYEHILESVSDSFLDVMKQYDFKKYADFSNVNSGYGTWAATSYIGVHGLAKAILDFGSGTLKNLKELIELKRA